MQLSAVRGGSVHNNLRVVLPDSDYRDDVQLTTAANNALGQNITVPDGLEAVSNDGHVILTGTVSYLTERAAAETAVAGLTGVRNVRNDIDIWNWCCSWAADGGRGPHRVPRRLVRRPLSATRTRRVAGDRGGPVSRWLPLSGLGHPTRTSGSANARIRQRVLTTSTPFFAGCLVPSPADFTAGPAAATGWSCPRPLPFALPPRAGSFGCGAARCRARVPSPRRSG
jgi:hypothetical protein